MDEKSAYTSAISTYISGFIDEKHALGYKYINGSRIMRRFDKYWAEHNYGNVGLSPENLADWMQMKDSEGAANLLGRISIIRQFAKYLNGLGIKSHIPPVEVRYEVPARQPFSKSEIKELFCQIDAYAPSNHARSGAPIHIANEYPILFRLIYLNGMRLSEACNLHTSDLDLENGIITILDGKGHKDRLIYLADDTTTLCIKYLGYLRNILNEEPIWLFPGVNPHKHLHISSVEYRFDACLKKTTFIKNRSIKPTIHDLRHTFVVDRINQWMEQGLSFDHMLPYLSKFLGHKSFKETFYYYHYVEEAVKLIRRKDQVIEKVIPEVMRR